MWHHKWWKMWHHNKPAKRGPPTKTHRSGKGDINQKDNKETNNNSEGGGKLHN